MDTAPVIQRLHPGLDSQQREVITHTDGPLLVVAGPGSGKTLCIQLRAVNLLLAGHTAPEELVLCTFGRDAARRLGQRFTAAARACGVPGDPSRVRTSTIHGLCHRVLTTHTGTVGLRPGYRLLGEEEQQALLCRELDAVLGPDRDTLSRRGWREGLHGAAEAARYFDRICDELINIDVLAGSERPFTAVLARCLRRYRELLLSENAVDFAHLQVWAEQVLRHRDVADEVSGAIRHLMVDEFQDTSRVQMRILRRLAMVHGNIAVVGDDDQSIYRFRGASVANLLRLPEWFPQCQVLRLTTNYRSHRGIVAACGEWMDTAADWEPPDSSGRSFRFPKRIVPHAPDAQADYPFVISVQGRDSVDEARQMAELLRFLKDSSVVASYGQAALLLHSVKDGVSGPYLDGLEAAGIPARCEPAGHNLASAGDEMLVTTTHQAKGREWDVVIVGSLNGPDLETDRVGRNLAEYFDGCSGEPAECIGDFDRARLHYVAFTRAKHLLELTAAGEPTPGSALSGKVPPAGPTSIATPDPTAVRGPPRRSSVRRRWRLRAWTGWWSGCCSHGRVDRHPNRVVWPSRGLFVRAYDLMEDLRKARTSTTSTGA